MDAILISYCYFQEFEVHRISKGFINKLHAEIFSSSLMTRLERMRIHLVTLVVCTVCIFTDRALRYLGADGGGVAR